MLGGMQPAASPIDDGLWSPQRRALTIGLVLTITLVAFEALAVSTVMPIVARELGGMELYGWVFTSFFLGSLIGIAVVGGLIDQGGLGRPFAAGLGLFAIGLLVGGLAPNMEVLVAARFIQGLGAGTIPPIAYVAIGRSLPDRLRPRMFATLSTAWVLPGVLGPAIAGVVGEVLGWRYVFLGLLPLIAAAGLLTIRALAAVPPTDAAEAAEAAAATAERRRLPNALLVAAGAGLITVGLTTGDLLPTIGLVALGLLLGIPAIRRLTPEGTLTARPILPAAVLLRGVMTFMFFGVDAYVSLTLEEYRGLSAVVAGIVLTVATVSWTAGSWIQARNAERWPTAHFVRAGFLVAVIGLATFSLDPHPRRPGRLGGTDLRGGRPRDGSRLRAALAHRPARGAARHPGHGIERAQPLGHPRDGDGHRRLGRDHRREPAGHRGQPDGPGDGLWRGHRGRRRRLLPDPSSPPNGPRPASIGRRRERRPLDRLTADLSPAGDRRRS